MSPLVSSFLEHSVVVYSAGFITLVIGDILRVFTVALVWVGSQVKSSDPVPSLPHGVWHHLLLFMSCNEIICTKCPVIFLLPALLYLLEDIVTSYIKNQLLECAQISSVSVWNKLPSHINFSSIRTFKRSISNNDFSAFLKRY